MYSELFRLASESSSESSESESDGDDDPEKRKAKKAKRKEKKRLKHLERIGALDHTPAAPTGTANAPGDNVTQALGALLI